MAEVQAYSHERFNEICQTNGWNDSNVEELTDKAFISIIGTEDVLKYYLDEEAEHWFRENHHNVLNLEFDDVEDDIVWDDYKAIALSNEKAKEIVEFIERNLGSEFLIHCRCGVSRSYAIAQWIKRNFPQYKGAKLHDGGSPNMGVTQRLNKVLWDRAYSDEVLIKE